MEWVFKSYDKIPSSSKRWGIEEDDARRLFRRSWVVTEKVHGANFCFIIDNSRIQCAKRKALLSEGEDFFHHHRLLARLGGSLRALFDALSASRVMIYGELFGGRYPHPDVPVIDGLNPIPTGVW